MRKIALALAVSLGLVALPTMAADPGFYIGAGIGQFNAEIDGVVEDEFGDLIAFKIDEDDTGFKVFGGYQFLPWLGAELAYLDGGEPSISAVVDPDDPGYGSEKLEIGVTAITVAAVGTLPIGDLFELYGKLGIAFWDGEIKGSSSGQACQVLIDLFGTCSASLDDDGEDFFYGIGAGVNIGEHFNIRLEYEVLEIDPTGLNADANFLSASAVYRF